MVKWDFSSIYILYCNLQLIQIEKDKGWVTDQKQFILNLAGQCQIVSLIQNILFQ